MVLEANTSLELLCRNHVDPQVVLKPVQFVLSRRRVIQRKGTFNIDAPELWNQLPENLRRALTKRLKGKTKGEMFTFRNEPELLLDGSDEGACNSRDSPRGGCAHGTPVRHGYLPRHSQAPSRLQITPI